MHIIKLISCELVKQGEKQYFNKLRRVVRHFDNQDEQQARVLMRTTPLHSSLHRLNINKWTDTLLEISNIVREKLLYTVLVNSYFLCIENKRFNERRNREHDEERSGRSYLVTEKLVQGMVR